LHHSRQQRIRAADAWRRPTPLWLQLAGYGLVGLVLLAVLAAFAVYVLPAATVTIVPGQRQVEAPVTLTASPDVDAVDIQGRLLPGRLMETYIEMTGTIATSGSEQEAQGKAVGQVVFTNQTNRSVRIPAGTIVSTSTGSRSDFRTTSETEVPAPQGSQATANIEALEEGVQGNARANTITTVSGALRTQVGVTNPSATGGGQSALVRVVKQVDKDTLLDQVYAQIQSEAFARLQPELRANEWLSESSIQTFIVAQFFDHFNDEPADELGLTLRVLVQGVAVDQNTAREIAMAALQEAVPERGKLVADSIQFLADPNATASERTVRFTIVGRGNYVIPIDNRELRSSVAGLSVEEATQLLQEQWLLQKPPEFYVDPDWFGTLPRFGSRIQVRVEFDQAAQGE
ncbi:MAG: baseplate J/gp47 family protein, partial [Caldilineaceae bacterium]